MPPAAEPSTLALPVPSNLPSNLPPSANPTPSSWTSAPPPAPAPAPSTLRILTFGDSLMAGFSNYGMTFHPPAIQLRATLQSSLPPNTTLTVDTNGQSGDLVGPMGNFLPRLLHCCPPPPSPRTYDIVVILGGTNDLCYAFTPAQIFASLVRVWEAALATGARVVAATVPERSADFMGERGRVGRAKREELNLLIKRWGAEGWTVMDLCAEVPWGAMGEGERKLVWDDGLHFTERGYGIIGEVTGRFILGMLGVEGGVGDKGVVV